MRTNASSAIVVAATLAAASIPALGEQLFRPNDSDNKTSDVSSARHQLGLDSGLPIIDRTQLATSGPVVLNIERMVLHTSSAGARTVSSYAVWVDLQAYDSHPHTPDFTFEQRPTLGDIARALEAKRNEVVADDVSGWASFEFNAPSFVLGGLVVGLGWALSRRFEGESRTAVPVETDGAVPAQLLDSRRPDS